MPCRLLGSIWRDSGGSALVEGSIILPVLFILVSGVFEFSWVICQQQLILAGISDAARYIAQSATPNDSTTKKNAKNLATTGAVDGDMPRVRGWTADKIDISYTFINNATGEDGLTSFRGGKVIESVTVSTTFTVPPLGFFSILKVSPPTLNISHQERIVGSG
jgi:hypothetical protein